MKNNTHTEFIQMQVPKIGSRWVGLKSNWSATVTDFKDGFVYYKYDHNNESIPTSPAKFFSVFRALHKTPEELLNEVKGLLYGPDPNGKIETDSDVLREIRNVLEGWPNA
jgi:hypothetical protein